MKRMASASVCLNEESEEMSVNTYSYENNNFSSNLLLILSVHSSSAFTEVDVVCENFCEEKRVWIFMGMARNDMGLYMCRVCMRNAQVPIRWTCRVCTFNSISNSKWECKCSTGWLIRPTDIKEWIFQVNELWGSPWHGSLWPPVFS